ncbi:MAG TPA: choice-of-anchor D domain-containing protein [Bacteroidota bacterium]|nr:choice-of-anchor D domain-containing protein [Bacteroidota bacterium]
MKTTRPHYLVILTSLIFATSLFAQLSFRRIPMQWETVTPYQIMAVTVSPKSSSVFTLAYEAGIMRSSDAGASWDIVLPVSTDSPELPRSLMADDSGNIYLGTPSGELYRGTNDGTQWVKIATLPYPIESICPSKTGTLFAAAGWLYYSTDGGNTWNYRNDEWFRNCFLVAETPGGQLIAASAYNRNITRSMDGGKTWTLDSGSIAGSVVTPVTFAANQHGAFLIWYTGFLNNSGETFGGILRSTATARTWETKFSGFGSAAIVTDRDGDFIISQLFSPGKGTMLFSDDDGVTLKPIDGPTEFHAATDKNQFYYCGGDGSYLYRGKLMPVPGPLQDFGPVGVNNSRNLQLTISNPTSTTISLIAVWTNSTAFGAITPLPISIPANNSSVITVAFTPKSYGSFADTLRIFNVTDDELRVPVQGICPYPSMILSTSLLDFGPLNQGTSGMMGLTIRSSSLSPLRVDSLGLSSREFTFAPISFPLSLSYGDSLEVTVFCTSTGAQNAHDTLRVYGNAIQGVGAVAALVNYADLVVAPKDIDFIQAKVDSTSSGSLFLTNPYRSPLRIDTIYTRTSTFSAAQGAIPNVMTGHATYRLPLAFHPTLQRFFYDTLFIATEGAHSLTAVPLRGTGSAFNRIVSLSLGNTWAYKYHSLHETQGQTSTWDYTTQKRVIGDTTIGAQVWKILQVASVPDTTSHSFELWRCDTTLLVSSSAPGFQGTLFNRLVTADSSWLPPLKIQTTDFVIVGSNDQWGGFRSSQQWGESYNSDPEWAQTNSSTTVDGIGPASYTDDESSRMNDSYTSSTGTLAAALIDGVVYGDTTLVSVREEQAGVSTTVSTYLLLQNYPNPFNPVTTIAFRIADIGVRNQSHVKLVVYDLLGREVRVLVNEVKAPGTYSVRFDGSGLASGVYFYRLQADAYVQTKKFILLK